MIEGTYWGFQPGVIKSSGLTMAAWPEASHCFGVTGLRPRPPRRLRLWVRNWLAKDPGLGMAASARRAARWRTDRAISSLASWNKRQQLSKLYIHCWTYKAKLYKTRNIFIKKLCFNVDYKSEIAFHFFFQLFSTPKKLGLNSSNYDFV